MITQFANKKLERIQLLLGVVLFCVFISYSLNHAFPIYSTYIIIAIIIQAVAVLILMQQMIQNKTSVYRDVYTKMYKYVDTFVIKLCGEYLLY